MQNHDFSTNLTSDNKYYTYKVRVGYTPAASVEGTKIVKDKFAIAEGEIVISDVSTEDNARTFTVTWGDLNGTGTIDTTDVMGVVNKAMGDNTPFTIKDDKGESFSITTGDPLGQASFGTVIWGDLDGSGTIDTTDVMGVVNKAMGDNTPFTIKGTTTVVNTGDPVKVTRTE